MAEEKEDIKKEELQNMVPEKAYEAIRGVIQKSKRFDRLGLIPAGKEGAGKLMDNLDKLTQMLAQNKGKSLLLLTAVSASMGQNPFLGAATLGTAVMYQKGRNIYQNKSKKSKSTRMSQAFEHTLSDLGMDEETKTDCMERFGRLSKKGRQALLEQMELLSLDKTMKEQMAKKSVDKGVNIANDDMANPDVRSKYKDLLVHGVYYPEQKVNAIMASFEESSDEKQLKQLDVMQAYIEQNPEQCKENQNNRIRECREAIVSKFSDIDVCSVQLLAHGSGVRYDGHIYDADPTNASIGDRLLVEQYICDQRKSLELPDAISDPSARYKQWLTDGFGMGAKDANRIVSESHIKEMSYSDAMDAMYLDLRERAQTITPEQEQAAAHNLQTGRQATRRKIVEHFMTPGSDGKVNTEVAALHLDNFRRMRSKEYDLNTIPDYTWDELSSSNKSRALGDLFYEQRKIGKKPESDLDRAKANNKRVMVDKTIVQNGNIEDDIVAPHAAIQMGEDADSGGKFDRVKEMPEIPSIRIGADVEYAEGL